MGETSQTTHVIEMECIYPFSLPLWQMWDYLKQTGRINGYTQNLCSGNGLIICKCYFIFSDSSKIINSRYLEKNEQIMGN